MPDALKNKYILGNLIAASKHNVIYELFSKENHHKFALKILSKKYFYKSLYTKISSLQINSFLLPTETFSDTFYVYFVMPYYNTLSHMICTNGISYADLKNLVFDIGQAILTLHEEGILHLDITPQNIYVDWQNHFYLGDFSSSCFFEKFNLHHAYRFNGCLRTGTTPAFAPPETIHNNFVSYWNDQYSFCFLLYLLFNHGASPLEHHTSEPISFSNINQILKDAMKPSQKTHSNTKKLLYDLKEALDICDQQPDCQNFHLKVNDTMITLFKDTTPDLIFTKKIRIQKPNFLSKDFYRKLSIPTPLYGLLILSGLIFLLSLYHFLSTRQQNTYQVKQYELTATSASPSAITSDITSDVSTAPAITNFSTASPCINPTPASSNTILDISGHSYHDDSFFAKRKDISNLKILFASQNLFRNCKAFCNLSSLEELYLNDNSMTALDGISKLSKLKVLVLSKNDLHDISELSKVSSLTTIDLSHNAHLTQIKTLSKLTHLQYLILTNTNITKKEVLTLQKKLPLCTILY